MVGARTRRETYPVVTRRAITKPKTIETTVIVALVSLCSSISQKRLTRQEDRSEANVEDEVVKADNHGGECSMNDNSGPYTINDRSLRAAKKISDPAQGAQRTHWRTFPNSKDKTESLYEPRKE